MKNRENGRNERKRKGRVKEEVGRREGKKRKGERGEGGRDIDRWIDR